MVKLALVALGTLLSAGVIYTSLWPILKAVPSLDTLENSQAAQQMVLRHVPGYGQFYIQDPNGTADFDFDEVNRAIESTRLYCGERLLTTFVASEYTEIPITVAFSPKPPTPDASRKWDRVVECSIDIPSGRIVFAGCPDGPVYGRFGEVAVKPGSYRFRVHFGGQDSAQIDGSTSDFYLVQIWSSDRKGVQVLKPGA
jgi:hypothetical protein